MLYFTFYLKVYLFTPSCVGESQNISS